MGPALPSGAVPLRTDAFDLGGLRLSCGEGRRFELRAEIDPFLLGGERYCVEPRSVAGATGGSVAVRLDVSRTRGDGYALRLRFHAALAGPCVRCLEPAQAVSAVDAREASQPKEIDELDSPYVGRGVLDLRAWARDSLALALPAALLCRPDCAGLCPVCGVDLNAAGPAHAHQREQPDGRWAKLSEVRFE